MISRMEQARLDTFDRAQVITHLIRAQTLFSRDQMYNCHVCCSYWLDLFSQPISLKHLGLSRNTRHYLKWLAWIPSPRLSQWYILVIQISQKETFEAIFLNLLEMSWFMAQFSDHIPIAFQDFFSYCWKKLYCGLYVFLQN